MNLSYWERDFLIGKPDFIVVGSGIVGLTCALTLKQQAPSSRIIVLERGSLPSGASTKNAGFACFGSLTELLNDVELLGEQGMLQLVQKRWQGLTLLRKIVGDVNMDYQQHGGFELIKKLQLEKHPHLEDDLTKINSLLKSIFNQEVFRFSDERIKSFGFQGLQHLIENPLEGQINTGMMMNSLINLCHEADIKLLYGVEVNHLDLSNQRATLTTNLGTFDCKGCAVATNAFATRLIPDLPVIPGRAQVMITKEIPQLNILGTFHYEEGYYYFRNINNRILIGGARHLAEEEETTTEFGTTDFIQSHIHDLLTKVILPNSKIEIDYSWSGIMGLGTDRSVLLKSINEQVQGP